MKKVITSGEEELIKATIRPKEETYFLVTGDNLKSITGTNILTDVFFLIASLLWGAYISVAIATSTSMNIPVETMIALETYQKVFLVCAIVVTALAITFLTITYIGIYNIRKSSLPAT